MIQYSVIQILDTYKKPLCKLLFKSIIFTIITVPIYFNIIIDQEKDVDFPFSAYSSIAFFMIDTLLLIELPLMLLAINSFLVWSVNKSRTNVINYLDITCIIWVIACFLICLNFKIPKQETSYFLNKNYWIQKSLYWLIQLYNKIHYVYKNLNESNIENSEISSKVKVPIVSGLSSFVENGNDFYKITHLQHNGNDNTVYHNLADNPTTVIISNISTSNIVNENDAKTHPYTLLLLLNSTFTLCIIIVLKSSLKQYVIDYSNANMYTIIGAFSASSILIVPHHYYKKTFIVACALLVIGFFIKLLFIQNIIPIDTATGLFHLFVAISCQIFSKLIV